jgi:hypothetical protein
MKNQMKRERIQKKRRNSRIFKYLQRHPGDECRKIIHRNRLLEINMQELKPEEESAHQNSNI